MKNSFFLLCFCFLLSNCVSKPTVSTTTKSPPPIAPNIPVINANTAKEKAVLAKPFVGVTTNGEVQKDLFSVKETGISTELIQRAVNDFLGSLSSQQQEKCSFPIDDKEWRRWHNIDEYERQGIALFEMSEEQKALVFKILEASLSPQGVEKSKNIMKMEGYLKILAKRFNTRQSTLDKLGDDKYYFTFMGTPSDDKPWGWQLDGHHLVINYFLLGDQIVMTPVFMGSEPNYIEEGPHKGLRTFKAEEEKGLAFYQALTPTQKSKATLWDKKDHDYSQTEAFHDNQIMPYVGLPIKELNPAQQTLFLVLVQEYVHNMKAGHAQVKMDEVQAHLANTWFSWIGGSGAEDPFYYRIHSPVILIEFDHHSPVFVRDRDGPRPGPAKWHVHTVVRTPNGNDYGKDLLRQHLETHH